MPGLYAVLHALGVIPAERLLRLRRLGGLDGHPDVGVPGIEANSGSLGMGLSKGRGIAWAKRHLGRGGRVVVMTGDGELQEGQNWEALQAAAHQRLGNLWAIVDRNELQSDKPTEEILALGDLEAKLRAFGWHVARCDGHDHAALRAVLRGVARRRRRACRRCSSRETIKGKGVSFMEHPRGAARGRRHVPLARRRARRRGVRARRTPSCVARIEARRGALGLGAAAARAGAPLERSARSRCRASPESGAGASRRAEA